MRKAEVVVVWFRHDLRLEDNVAFYHAAESGYPILPLFIFDKDILEQFSQVEDRRVQYIHEHIVKINDELKKYNSGILCYHSTVSQVFEQLTDNYLIKAVYSNEDYEPQAIQRDCEVASFLQQKNIPFYQYKDHVIFRGGEILKQDGTAYQVYTPYAKKWRSLLTENNLFDYTVALEKALFHHFQSDIISLEQLGYRSSENRKITNEIDLAIISTYDQYRDYPGIKGTSLLGTALRFGTISIRKCVRIALKENDVWLSELIWREFFSQIMYLYPAVEKHCFKSKYEGIKYRNNEEDFLAWCEGNTGYPLVDAGMRELNATGFMHNRVRMVVASFLVKHLLIDWRWGEAYFAQQLLDYDLASNNGNWQWVAGCGCDAAPYFRIFNPTEQAKKFDKDGSYMDKWVPEWRELYYRQPIVEHKFARERALEVFKEGLKEY